MRGLHQHHLKRRGAGRPLEELRLRAIRNANVDLGRT